MLVAVEISADNTNEDIQSWGNVTAITSLGRFDPALDKVKLWLEAQGRFGDDISKFSQAILRTALGYSVYDNLSFWFGYAWIPSEPTGSSSFDEHRLWQQMIWNHSLAGGKFMSRSRLEQRFDERGDDVGWRYRQFLKYYHPIKAAPKLSWVVWNEVFVGLNRPDWKADNGFDQNRAFVGLGFQMDKQVRTEFGYINQYIRKPSANDAMNHIISLNVFMNF
nr:DUF2490 domain-containing protein [Methylomarinum sp. Ch1-1]MDP4521454.1 DUF2490 domain-containing protein [Methylomarinum sp. Ch1-1]